MIVVASFVAGLVAGWLLMKLAIKHGTRLLKNDEAFAKQLLDGLGYDALLKLRDRCDSEIQKRAGKS